MRKKKSHISTSSDLEIRQFAIEININFFALIESHTSIKNRLVTRGRVQGIFKAKTNGLFFAVLLFTNRKCISKLTSRFFKGFKATNIFKAPNPQIKHATPSVSNYALIFSYNFICFSGYEFHIWMTEVGTEPTKAFNTMLTFKH